MLRVHQSQIEQHNNPGLPRITERLIPTQSARLALIDTSDRAQLRGAPLREDHPPFTIERPDDHEIFRDGLRAPTDRGRELRRTERNGFNEVLQDPALVQRHLEEGSQRTEHGRFDVRATKRGRTRAAVQIALRSFATNREQHFVGGWRHRVLRLPAEPLPEPSVPAMALPAKGAEGSSIDPFEWTKKVLDLQKRITRSGRRPTVKPPSQCRGIFKAACKARLIQLITELFQFLYDCHRPEEDPEDEVRHFGEDFKDIIDDSDLAFPLSMNERIRLVTQYCEENDWWLDEDHNRYALLDENLDKYVIPTPTCIPESIANNVHNQHTHRNHATPPQIPKRRFRPPYALRNRKRQTKRRCKRSTERRPRPKKAKPRSPTPRSTLSHHHRPAPFSPLSP